MAAKMGLPDIERQAASKDREKMCFFCPASYPATYSSCPRCQLPLVFPSIGRVWVVEGLLGRGGMGAVFAAHHMSDPHRKAAVKVLVPVPGEQLADRRDRIGRFHREALALRRLTHENIVQLYDFARERDGSLYLAMERLDGPTLSAMVKREGPLPVERAVALLLPVLSAVAAAHKVGVIHRDLKPDNIVLANSGHGQTRRQVIKVVDFGVARLAGDTFTRTGQALGTPVYMPPEQANGTDIDERVDIYGAGAVLYELLCGRAPFQAPDAPNANLAVLAMVVTTEPRAPRELRPELPPALEAVVLRAMRRNREERFATAGAFSAAIEEALKYPSRVSWVPPVSAATPRPLSSQSPVLQSLGQDSLPPRGASPLMAQPMPLRRPSGESPVSGGIYSGAPYGGAAFGPALPLPPGPPGPSATQIVRPAGATSLGVKLLVVGLYLVVVVAIVITLLLDRLGGRLSGQRPTPGAEVRAPRLTQAQVDELDIKPEPSLAPLPPSVAAITPSGTPSGTPPLPSPPSPPSGAAPPSADARAAAAPADCPAEMQPIPGGCFVMGSDEDRADPDERPSHEVCLSRGYCLDRTEVTNSDYRACVRDGRCRPLGQNFQRLKRVDFVQDDQPVVLISWTDAYRYCAALGKRLPTEAEWEHAARGPERWRYPFGNDEPECAQVAVGAWPLRCRPGDAACKAATRCVGKNPPHPIAVGSRPGDRGPYGTLDLGGNVSEWVADFYEPRYYARAPRHDPKGPEQSRERVHRGGSFGQLGPTLRATYRNHLAVTSRGDIHLGFRCAR